MLVDLIIKDFLAETAGDKITPGGGSISALYGALATALTEMAAKLAVKDGKYPDVAGQMKVIAIEASLIRDRLIGYIDRNHEVCERLVSVSGLSGEREDKSNAVQDAAREAVLAPMQVAEEIASVMETIIYVAKKGDRKAIADISIAMMTARTAVLSALLKVRINLVAVQDEAFVKRMKEKADLLESEAVRIETKLLNWVRTLFI